MTDSALTLAQTRLLLPGGLDPAGLDRAFGTLLGPGIDFGDLYFQHSRRESWTAEDGIVKDGAHSIEQGVGVRAISGEKTGFAYSDDINADALRLAAGSARAIAREGAAHAPRSLVRAGGHALYAAVDPIDGMGNEDKVEQLRALDRLLRGKIEHLCGHAATLERGERADQIFQTHAGAPQDQRQAGPGSTRKAQRQAGMVQARGKARRADPIKQIHRRHVQRQPQCAGRTDRPVEGLAEIAWAVATKVLRCVHQQAVRMDQPVVQGHAIQKWFERGPW